METVQKGKEQLPTLDQLMEEEDLEQIRVVMTARFSREDRERLPKEYARRAQEEAHSDAEDDDEEDDEKEEIRKLSEELDVLAHLTKSLEPSKSSPQSAGALKSMKAEKPPAAARIK